MAYEDLDDYSVGAAGGDTFEVVIPDLDPSSAIPIQLRWKFADGTYGEWSTSKTLDTPELARPEATNITAIWNGVNLEISWEAPPLSSLFTIYLTSGSTTIPFAYSIDKTKASQKAIVSAANLMNAFGGFLPSTLTGLLKTIYIDTSTTGLAFAIPPYSDSISNANIPDSDWSVLAVANGYTVSWTGSLVSSPTYDYTEVYKSSSINGTYEQIYAGRGPAILTVETLSTNYIKIKHSSITSLKSNFSNVKEAVPYDPVTFDDTPPDNDVTLGPTPTAALDSSALFQFNYKVPFTWSESADTSVRGYRIRFRIKNSGDPYTYMSVPGKSTISAELQGLLAGATYEIGVTTYDVYSNVNATYKTYPDIVVPGVAQFAQGGVLKAGDMAIGYGVGSSSTNRGMYLAPNNYWYVQGNTNVASAARLSVGGATDSMVWDGTSLSVTGTVNANAGKFTGSIQVGDATTYGQFKLQTPANTKIEMGALTNSTGTYTGAIGIQGTDASGQLFQLDTGSGIIVNKGTIGGWTINSTSIYKNNTSLGSDGSISAGSAGEFQVTAAGALTATGATITGKIYANEGRIGNDTLGWTFNANTISSYAAATNGQITLNSSTGTISGGLISGTKIRSGQFSVDASEVNNYWNATEFRAGSGNTYIKSLASGTITLFASTTSTSESDQDSASSSSYSSVSIPSQINITSSAVEIQGIPGVGNGLTYIESLELNSSGAPSTSITYYSSFTASQGFGAAARYRMIIADPYDNNKLKRGLGVYYGTKSNAPTASTGFVGDLWVSW